MQDTKTMYIMVMKGSYKGSRGYITECRKGKAVCCLYVDAQPVNVLLNVESFEFVEMAVML